MSLINSTAIPSGAGYEIGQSLRFEDSSSAYLSWTPSSAGNTKTWTWSGWVKGADASLQTLFSGGTGSGNNSFNFRIDAGIITLNTASTGLRNTTAKFRDFSAWYHILLAVDTTQSTDTNRLKLYINGSQVTDFASGTIPSQNTDLGVNRAELHTLGRRANSADRYLNGYLAEVNFIDGSAKVPSDFGETGDYGEWKPIEYSGSYGTNGFYLNFATAADMGDDKSGNTNDFTENNIAASDQMLDSPTNNFATLNPLVNVLYNPTLSEGNLKTTYATTNVWNGSFGTMSVSSGKYYWELLGSGGGYFAGLFLDDGTINYSASPYTYAQVGMVMIYGEGGSNMSRIDNNDISGKLFGGTSAGDVIGIAVDMDNGTFKAYNNNSLKFTMDMTASGHWGAPMIPAHMQHSYNGSSSTYNFGQDSSFAGAKTAQGNTDGNNIGDFYYTPPSGFLALCTKNLPDVAVIPSEHFNTVLYTGNGASARNITGVGFTPDLTWNKMRSQANNHTLMNVLSGTGKNLHTNTTDAEATGETYPSIITDGIVVSAGNDNNNGSGFVFWNWKANGSGSSNTNGSITSTVSANVDAGFSIVSWTSNGSDGLAIGHGLSSAPQIIIYKPRANTNEWYTWLNALVDSSQDYVRLNSTAAKVDINSSTNGVPSSTLISNFGFTNNHTMIAYCFHSVDGYSKVGSYTGNGNADGTFVYTGFRPAWVMVKRTDNAENWVLYDNLRAGYNADNDYVLPNTNAAEYTGYKTIDLTSNGFKLRTTHSDKNASGTFIYLAFAETPFKHSNAR